MTCYSTKRRATRRVGQGHILEEWPGTRGFAELHARTCREARDRFRKLNNIKNKREPDEQH